MRRVRRFFARCLSLLFRRRAEEDLAREVASHLALLEDEFLGRGMGPEEARLTARKAYGGVEQAKELHRDERSFVQVEQAIQDVRHACRSLAKSPGFTAVALVSLACGIGVNTAIFTLADGILLKELPVREPHRIVQINARLEGFTSSGFSYPAYRELRRQRAVFADVAGFWMIPVRFDSGNRPARTDLEMVTGSYFAFFEGRPALGRLLGEEDDRVDGAGAVCVLNYRTWQARFGGDPKVLGSTVQINDLPFQVVGVATPDFVGPELQRQADLWAPTSVKSVLFKDSREAPNWIWIKLLGRLKPGVPLPEARARLAGASRGIEDALPKDRANAGAVYELQDASKGFDRWRTTLQNPLLLLMAAVALVLLIACANVANLMLARGSERRQEFAIKLALGISRWRLWRQLVLESLLLAAAGGAAGLAASFALIRFLLDLFNTGNNYAPLAVAPDRSAWLFTFTACAAAVLISGLYPAWRASRTEAAANLKPVSAGPGRSLLRRALIVAQVALAVVLLFGASLFTRSLRNLKTIPLGYDISRVLAVDIGHQGPVRPGAAKPRGSLDEALARVRRLPLVESAAFAAPGLLSGVMMVDSVTAKDSSGAQRQIDNVHFLSAGPGYLATMRVPLLRGREFTAADRPGSPPRAIINERLASMIWPGENPIGKTFTREKETVEVIGLVGDTKYYDVREQPRPMMVLAFDPAQGSNITLAVRCRSGCGSVERDVRNILRDSAPGYDMQRASTMDRLRDGNISLERLLAFLCDMFGALGTALALVGIYGLVSYSVARRTREIGIRVSIGAQRAVVLWLFVRETLALTAAGLLIGLPLAVQLAGFGSKMLFAVAPKDPAAIAVTLGLIALGGAIASAVPAGKAARVNPVEALRYD
jgi:predicted permease